MTTPRLPDSTSTAWLVLGAATGFVTDVPLPRALLQHVFRTTSIGPAAINAAIDTLIADGLLHAVDATTIAVPAATEAAVEPLLTDPATRPTLLRGVEAALADLLLPVADAAHALQVTPVLPQARQLTMRAYLRQSPLAYVLLDALAQVLVHLGDAEALTFVYMVTIRSDRDVPPNEVALHARSLLTEGTLRLAGGEPGWAGWVLERAWAFGDARLPRDHPLRDAIHAQRAAADAAFEAQRRTPPP